MRTQFQAGPARPHKGDRPPRPGGDVRLAGVLSLAAFSRPEHGFTVYAELFERKRAVFYHEPGDLLSKTPSSFDTQFTLLE